MCYSLILVKGCLYDYIFTEYLCPFLEYSFLNVFTCMLILVKLRDKDSACEDIKCIDINIKSYIVS